MKLSDWFLTAAERGNDATEVDRRHEGRAWSEGNRTEVLVHGAEYFARLYDALCQMQPGDWVHFTDWRGDPDERLAGPGTEVARVLADIARRGVGVRGLIWRSHPDQAHFSEQENLHLAETVNEAGGEVLLDERVRRLGSHHQKLFVIRRPNRPSDEIAFAGGIDLCHGRRDDDRHVGDEQALEINDHYGEQPGWHDVQLEVHGPAVGDLAHTFRERWEDPTPLERRTPWRRAFERLAHEPSHPDPLPPPPPDPPPAGPHAVQVLRTYPVKRPPYPFAPGGERSIARAYIKALRRAGRLIYLEDQYLWSLEAAEALAGALRRSPELQLVAVVPRYPDEDGRLTGPPTTMSQQRVIERLRDAGGDRVAVYDLETPDGEAVYVHAKVCVIDDVWLIVGSDNLNRRSWSHDSELACAVIDETIDGREPADPAGLGDGARRLARATRLRLWTEHLDRDEADVDDLVDPGAGFEALRRSADALDGWHSGGRLGPRPHGRLRHHQPEVGQRLARWWAEPVYRLLIDPDGRPNHLRRVHAY